jgi:K(+)-stimulated pyrophosphate-energized sodium pump
MKGEKQPDYGPVIDICTAASLRELATPALLAVLTPVVVGFGIGFTALGAFLAAVILVGQLMANYLSNAGGAWDNAKKYIEDGNYGGKGSDSYRAAVIADTVGDPFKDTAGPALNPLIKVMNLVSLLILPAILSDSLVDKKAGDGLVETVTADPTGTARLIALGALVVLIISIAYSKRKGEGFGGTPPPPHSEVSDVVEHALHHETTAPVEESAVVTKKAAPARKTTAKKATPAKKATTAKKATPAKKATKKRA